MVANRWTVEDANRHLDEVLDRVKDNGPQEVARNDETFVVVTVQEWRQQHRESHSTLANADEIVEGHDQEIALEHRSEWSDQEFRNPFAWVEEMSDAEVDDWEQRMDEARERRTGVHDARER
jgi:prevent-host-death family protein